jgi:hypothetical protein
MGFDHPSSTSFHRMRSGIISGSLFMDHIQSRDPRVKIMQHPRGKGLNTKMLTGYTREAFKGKKMGPYGIEIIEIKQWIFTKGGCLKAIRPVTEIFCNGEVNWTIPDPFEKQELFRVANAKALEPTPT